MYAVIATGGKQERVEVGSLVNVELLGAGIGEDVKFAPVLIVDGPQVLVAQEALQGASVSARVVADTKGPKIVGFTYKAKGRARRRFGHRQHYSQVEITAIDHGGSKSAKLSSAKA